MRSKPKLSTDGFHEVYRSIVDVIYMTKLNRIARGYSAEEVSFLIGRHKNYVAQRESLLPNKDYRVSDLFWLATAYEMDTSSMIMNHTQEFKTIRIKTIVEKQGGVIKHTTQNIGKYRRAELLYQLYEYDSATDEKENGRNAQELEALTKLIRKLLTGKFFDGGIQTPLEIFRHCKSVLKKDIRPKLLEKALASFSDASKKPGLKKYHDQSEGYVYKKINARSISKSKK